MLAEKRMEPYLNLYSTRLVNAHAATLNAQLVRARAGCSSSRKPSPPFSSLSPTCTLNPTGRRPSNPRLRYRLRSAPCELVGELLCEILEDRNYSTYSHTDTELRVWLEAESLG